LNTRTTLPYFIFTTQAQAGKEINTKFLVETLESRRQIGVDMRILK
jgi:hypothetical protein